MKIYEWSIPVMPPLDFIVIKVPASSEHAARTIVHMAAKKEFANLNHAPRWKEAFDEHFDSMKPKVKEVLDGIFTFIAPP